MNPDRFVRSVARSPREQIRECLRACGLFERAGIWTPEEAHAMREAIRARAAELSESVGGGVERNRLGRVATPRPKVPLPDFSEGCTRGSNRLS